MEGGSKFASELDVAQILPLRKLQANVKRHHHQITA